MSNYTVYMHISPSGKRYIGITSKKKAEYRWNNGNGYSKNEYFTNAINKYGWDNFQHIIIARGLTEEEAKWLEIELIREYDSANREKGYNITLGGESASGCKWTEKSRQEQSERMSGENHPMYGIRGKNHPNFGNIHTEEWKQEQSERMSGKKHPKAILYKVINFNGEIVGIFCGNEIYSHHSKGFLNINQDTFNKYIRPFGNIDISRIKVYGRTKATIEKLTPYNGWQFIEISKEELETEVA